MINKGTNQILFKKRLEKSLSKKETAKELGINYFEPQLFEGGIFY